MITYKSKPVRVLHILTGLSHGGAESFIVNMYRKMDKNKVQFDFLLRSQENVYQEELQSMGSRFYYTASFPRHFIQNALQTTRFFSTHHYDIVHIHANALLYTFALSCAKRYGIKCRIVHSHNSAMAHMWMLPIHCINKKRLPRMATDFFACSDAAGKWMFSEPYSVVHNAIDLDIFTFNSNSRASARAAFGIEPNDLVIGHIGRFVPQKNHAFLVEIFAQIIKSKPSSKLLLIGDGELSVEIQRKVQSLGLQNQVIFAGARKDVSYLINAMDLLVFPSVYEGLGIVAIEAQANGLPIICSEAVPEQVLFSTSSRRLSLHDSAAAWATVVLNTEAKRTDVTPFLIKAGYSAYEEAVKLQDFYISKV